MPETAPDQITRIKIKSQPVPEYCSVNLLVSKVLGADIAGKPIVKAKVLYIGDQVIRQ